jgi:hypothetical protein
MKVTEPPLAAVPPAVFVTVAVNVALAPKFEGLGDEESNVVLGAGPAKSAGTLRSSSKFAPQQTTWLSFVIAHVCACPAPTCVNNKPGGGDDSPSPFVPQQTMTSVTLKPQL